MERVSLYQGEILVETPFFTMPKPSRWLVLRTVSGKRVDEALNYGKAAKENRVRVLDSNAFAIEWEESKLGDFVVGVLDKAPTIIVSQNCDVATKDYIHVAPVIEVPKEDEAYIDKLRRHDIVDAFYLESHPPEWESVAFVDFGLIQPVHRSYLKGIPTENHFRLSASRVIQLQRSLTRFFGRPNSYDANSDAVPRDGVYMCVQCFYRNGVVTDVSLSMNQAFPICRCGGVGWVPRLNSVPGS